MNNDACVKIYTESDSILVLESLYQQDREGYYPVTGSDSRFGTVVCGKDNISISDDAKKLFKEIIEKAEKTEDDISCLNIHESTKGTCIFWITSSTDNEWKHKIDINKLEETGFFIGTGHGYPKLSLLDELCE